MNSIESLIEEVRQCQTCALHLPHGTRPVLQASREARLLIASQAPGSKVHASGVPFADPSGDRLRAWTGLSGDIFYDAQPIAILPMGFCYPGRSAGGDAPPRRECAPLWRSRLLAHMPHIRLTLLVGSYAQAAALGPGKVKTVSAITETIYRITFRYLIHPGDHKFGSSEIAGSNPMFFPLSNPP